MSKMNRKERGIAIFNRISDLEERNRILLEKNRLLEQENRSLAAENKSLRHETDIKIYAAF